MRYAKPKSIDEAIALLGDGRWRMLAGGTDFYPAQGAKPLRDDVLDLNGLAGLRHVTMTDDAVAIGARATWSDIVRAPLPPAFDALRQAAREVGSIQIQNAATVAGNLCNASPAADGVPPLLTLDAEVELASKGGTRRLPLGEFLLGNRKTALRPDELMTAIRIPKSAMGGRSHFVKLGARRYLVISIAMAAARVVLDEQGCIAQAAIAIGSCSAVARRLAGLERALVGLEADEGIAGAVSAHDFAELSPIDDARAPAAYRREAAREIVKRALAAACGTTNKPAEAAA